MDIGSVLFQRQAAGCGEQYVLANLAHILLTATNSKNIKAIMQVSDENTVLLIVCSLSLYPHSRDAKSIPQNSKRKHQELTKKKLEELRAQPPFTVAGVYYPDSSPSEREAVEGLHVLLIKNQTFYLFHLDDVEAHPVLLQEGDVEGHGDEGQVYGKVENRSSDPAQWNFTFHSRHPNVLEQMALGDMQEKLLHELESIESAQPEPEW